MIRKVLTVCLLVALCLTQMLPAFAETREGVILLEGMEETISETLYVSPQGFSFWYADEVLEASQGEEAGEYSATLVKTILSDDNMVLIVIGEEQAQSFADEHGIDLTAGAGLWDLYEEAVGSKVLFCVLIADCGHYLIAAGEYAQEAAEGNAKYFRRVLDSVVFAPDDPVQEAAAE